VVPSFPVRLPGAVQSSGRITDPRGGADAGRVRVSLAAAEWEEWRRCGSGARGHVLQVIDLDVHRRHPGAVV
jgi:hypothetical protein